ncbi:hypothetical protein DBR06_SOUSAS23510002, partial [Sousa chinensis]
IPGLGLFPPLSLSCPRAQWEGDLTEAGGSGGTPPAEAAIVLGTTGQLFQQ